jgi:hypothetical protein
MRFICTFNVNGSSRQFEFSSYESQVLSWLKEPFPGKFLPRRKSQKMTVNRTELLAGVDQFLERMAREAEGIHYAYSIATKGKDGGEFSGSGGFSCNYKGARAVAESGPGFCRIRAVGEAGPVPGLAVSNILLADLRDMQPVRTDEGIEMIPQRKHHPIELEQQARDLAIFLHCQDGEQVDVTVKRCE